MPTTPVTTSLPEVKLAEEVRRPESLAHIGSGTAFWRELITHVAHAAGIDPQLAERVALRESRLNPDAINPLSGALGLMQLMPATAAALGVDPRDAVENVVGGVRYLREQLTHFGDEAKALAAYNWGPGRVTEAVERWGSDWLSHAPRETQHYVASILSSPISSSSILTSPDLSADAKPTSTFEYTSSGLVASLRPELSPEVASVVSSLREALNAYLVAAILE